MTLQDPCSVMPQTLAVHDDVNGICDGGALDVPINKLFLAFGMTLQDHCSVMPQTLAVHDDINGICDGGALDVPINKLLIKLSFFAGYVLHVRILCPSYCDRQGTP